MCYDNTKLDYCSENKPFICTINGLKEKPITCGCPLGERIFNEHCIPEVKCSDNTFEPECSINKPLQCINGELIDNPNLCGCPENFKLKDEKCIYIKCPDGTVEPDCSEKLKMQCIEGKYIYNPNKCGCQEGFVIRSDTCVKTCDDGTASDECSSNKPEFCEDGVLVDKASKCGCSFGSRYRQDGEICLDLSNPKVEVIEMLIHELINQERTIYGLSQLSYNNKIAQASRKHSQDMVTRNYFEHNSPEGQDFSYRYLQVGFSCDITIGHTIYGGAENIHQGWTYGTISYINGIESNKEWLTPNEIATSAVQGWMNSPGHKQNILTPFWRSEGIGVAVSDDGKVLITQDFC